MFILEIIREPETQYVLMGENATFECHATGAIEAHWDVNGVPLTLSYEKTKKEYVDQGFIFIDEKDISRESYNLTMIIPASLDFNNTVIFCVAISPGYNTQTQSRNVHLIVFDTLRKIIFFKFSNSFFYYPCRPLSAINFNR